MLTHYRQLMRPEAFHGRGQRPPFFEGWYYKLVSADGRHRLALIPALFIGKRPEDTHAFIQVFDGTRNVNHYLRYDATQFHADEEQLEVSLGGCRFTRDHVQVRIDRPELQLHGDIALEGTRPWPVTWRSPGVMGWFAWLPIMECYHGVVSMDHALKGSLQWNGERVDFEGGRGYVEKDWGRSFPSVWMWMQSNHFEHAPGTSFMASVAEIPLLAYRFAGFLSGLWHDGRLYRFATYTGARTTELDVSAPHVRWVVEDREHRLEVHGERGAFAQLAGPTPDDMERTVRESLSGHVELKLIDRRSARTVFEGRGIHAGMELEGDMHRITPTRSGT